MRASWIYFETLFILLLLVNVLVYNVFLRFIYKKKPDISSKIYQIKIWNIVTGSSWATVLSSNVYEKQKQRSFFDKLIFFLNTFIISGSIIWFTRCFFLDNNKKSTALANSFNNTS